MVVIFYNKFDILFNGDSAVNYFGHVDEWPADFAERGTEFSVHKHCDTELFVGLAIHT